VELVRPSSAGEEASREDKGMAELFGDPGPTRINFVPSGNEGRREGREMAVVTTAFGLVNCIAWLVSSGV